MAYKSEATDRGRLRRQLIETENRPCSHDGCETPFDRREVHRVKNGCNGGRYTEHNTIVLCFTHHHLEHINSKFRVGDKVRLHPIDARHPIPSVLGFTDYELTRPRTIVKVRYDHAKQCNYYTLGSNAKGDKFTTNGNPLDGYTDYEFRSYQLISYVPRHYHFKRAYTRKSVALSATPSNQNLQQQGAEILGTPARQPWRPSQEIIGK